MAAMPSTRLLRPRLLSTKIDFVPSLLVPSVQCTRIAPSAYFSTSPARCKKDNNPNRGISAVRGTGLRPRQTLSVKHKDFESQKLPTPVRIREKVSGAPDHGLWDFFKDRKLLQEPLEEQRHGRAWTVGELRSRDWDTLHQLWWVCVKERNRLATEKRERRRLNAGYGDHETKHRDETVQESMKAIMDTLAERQQAYNEALALAKQDPMIDLSRRDGAQFITEPAYDPLEPEDESYEGRPRPTSS